MDSHIAQYLKDLSATEPNLFIVGGALRDGYLGLSCTDFDFALKGASQRAAAFAKQIGGVLIALDDSPGRETYRVVETKGVTFDFSELQGESIEEDLARRDFTFNAMAQPLKDFLSGTAQILDPFSGLKDLEQKTVRALPGPVLGDDPLRVLRAFRFAAALNFEIDLQTMNRIEKAASGLKKIAGERIHQECFLFWQSNNTSRLTHQMNQTGIWNPIFPERAVLKDILTPNGKTTLLNESLAVYCRLEKLISRPKEFFPERLTCIASHLLTHHRPLLKASALLYPLYRGDSKILTETLNQLRFSKTDSNFILCVFRSFNRALETDLKFAGWSMDFSEIYQFVNETDPNLVPLLFLVSAFWIERNGTEGETDDHFLRSIYNIADFYLNRYLPKKKKPPFITGDDLIEQFKMKPSPLFKIILGQIEESRVLGSIESREQAETMVRVFIENL